MPKARDIYDSIQQWMADHCPVEKDLTWKEIKLLLITLWNSKQREVDYWKSKYNNQNQGYNKLKDDIYVLEKRMGIKK